MSPSTDPTRRGGGSPTVAEITALTTRLRDLSARARTVDPAGRAAFLDPVGKSTTRPSSSPC